MKVSEYTRSMVLGGFVPITFMLCLIMLSIKCVNEGVWRTSLTGKLEWAQTAIKNGHTIEVGRKRFSWDKTGTYDVYLRYLDNGKRKFVNGIEFEVEDITILTRSTNAWERSLGELLYHNKYK